MNLIPALLLSTLLAAPFPALAQQPAPTPKAAPEPDPDPAVLKAMKSKVFEIKHGIAYQLANSLRALGSGVRGCRMDYSSPADQIKTISVRDFPENIAVIEEAIKRLDVPSAVSKTPDVELHVQVLFASKQAAPAGNVPEELQPVIKSLKGSLAYRGYTLAASFVQRWDISSGKMIQGRGLVEGADLGFGHAKDPSQLRFEWEASPAYDTEQQLKTSASLKIPKFQLLLEERNSRGSNALAKIETSVSLKEGEHVVVGTSVIRDQGLVVVLTAKLLR